MAILDRSWYGRVLVERVEGFATVEEWTRAYDEINAFEEMLTLEGTGTELAPWRLAEGDSKRFARVKVLETVVEAAEDGLERHGRRTPPGSP